MKSLEVVVIDDDQHFINDILGITEERMHEIGRAIQKAELEYSTLTEVAVDVSKILKHPNELFWLGMQLGGHSIRMKIPEVIEVKGEGD